MRPFAFIGVEAAEIDADRHEIIEPAAGMRREIECAGDRVIPVRFAEQEVPR